MAFDHHIEADRIDDFNLFSAFVRVPLLILGGVLGRSKGSNIEEDLDGAVKVHRIDDDDDVTMSSSSFSSMGRHQSQSSEAYTQEQEEQSHTRIVSDYDMEDCDGLKRAKKMSWSDENGHKLVQYNDESVPYEPNPYSSATYTTKPGKSAMRRSRSVRNHDANGLQNLPSQESASTTTSTATRYIPNMNRAGNGLIMPSRPYGSTPQVADPSMSNGSEMSPQWGWYINTTPPTPEMYYGSSSFGGGSSSTSNRLVRSDMNGAPASPHIGSNAPNGKRYQNQVFQNLQSSNAPMGWTSVPI